MGARGEFLWVLVGQGLTLVLSIAMLKVLTWQLGAEEYGRFALGLSIAGVLNLFVYGPLVQAVSRYFHLSAAAGAVAEFNQLVGWLLRWIAVSVAVAMGLAFLVGDWLDLSLGTGWAALILIALLYGLASGTLSVYLADFNTRRQRRSYALLQSADALLRLAGAAALAAWAGATADLALAGFLLGSAVIMTVAWLSRRGMIGAAAARQGGRALFAPGSRGRQFAGYTLSFSLFAIPSMFICYGDRWVVQQTMSAADVGIYVAIAQIANAPANLMLAVFSYTLNPILFQQAGNAASAESLRSSRQLLYRAATFLVVVLAGVVAVSVVFDAWIVNLLTSPEFVPHARLLWILVLSASLFQIGQALASEAFVHNRPFLMLFPKLTHAALFIALAIWLIGRWQLEGVAIAAVVSAAVYLLLVVSANARARRTSVADAAMSEVAVK